MTKGLYAASTRRLGDWLALEDLQDAPRRGDELAYEGNYNESNPNTTQAIEKLAILDSNVSYALIYEYNSVTLKVDVPGISSCYIRDGPSNCFARVLQF